MSEPRRIRYTATPAALFHPERDPPLLGERPPPSDDALCAELARLTYRRFESSTGERALLEARFAAAGFTDATFFEAAGREAFGVVRASDATAFLAFRGTQSDDPRDAILDARVVLKPWRLRGRAHSGFAAGIDALLAAGVDRWLQDQAAARRALVCTGHSLGAAMATLCAVVGQPGRLVTFGSPRVGDATLVAALASVAVARYVDCCDVVAHLPPELLGYRHAGPACCIDRQGVVVGALDEAAVRADQTAARDDYRVLGAAPGSVPLRDLADHAPANYVAALWGIVD